MIRQLTAGERTRIGDIMTVFHDTWSGAVQISTPAECRKFKQVGTDGAVRGFRIGRREKTLTDAPAKK